MKWLTQAALRRLWPKKKGHRTLVAGAIALLLVVSGALTAFAVVIPPANTGGLIAVGPVSGDNGFPVWYKDSTGLRLEGCLDGADPLCGFVPGVDFPDPTRPISFPDNFPEEFFYQLASNVQDIAGGAGRATTTLALEGAFGSGPVKDGDQVVFARIRFFYSGLQPGATYRITHPYGVDEEVADDAGAIRFTEDIGLAPGVFTGALDGRVGPFLQWDPAVAPAAPVGFVGDPNVDHPVVGSPFNTNFVRVEGPGLAVIGNQSNTCSPATTDCIQTNLFSLLGKKATKAGFDIQRSVYSRADDTGGTIDLFATSDVDPQSIQIEGQGLDPVLMRGENGNYVAHIHFTGGTVPQLTVTNVSDTPPTVKPSTPVDAIKGQAVWNADDNTLTVNATSSDTFANPLLTATGFGDLSAGVLVANNVIGPPASVNVTSAVGGTVSLPVEVTGATFGSIPVSAFAGEDQEVLQGTTVTLDGTGSTGPITSFSWTQTAGPAVTLSGASTANPTFTAPTGDATLEFELTVDGTGGPSTDRVVVTVVASAAVPIANAGPDQTVNQTATVNLDGTGSEATTTFQWTQTDGPAVALNGANTATPSFVAPKQNVLLTFELTASGPGGSSTDTVEVSVNPDDITVTRAEFRISGSEWRIDGTDTIFGPGVSVTIYLGPTPTGAPLATNVPVDTLGAWSFREKNSAATPGGQTTITVVSSGGDEVLGFPLLIRN
jgi:hypothetical protein